MYVTGAAYPKLFVEHTMDDFEYANKLNYLGQVYGAHVCKCYHQFSGLFLTFIHSKQLYACGMLASGTAKLSLFHPWLD